MRGVRSLVFPPAARDQPPVLSIYTSEQVIESVLHISEQVETRTYLFNNVALLLWRAMLALRRTNLHLSIRYHQTALGMLRNVLAFKLRRTVIINALVNLSIGGMSGVGAWQVRPRKLP